jgi:type I restriction enzyme S subunit
MKLQDLVTVHKGKKPPTISVAPFTGSTGLILTSALRGEPISQFCGSFNGQVLASHDDIVITWDGSVGKSFCGIDGTVGSTLAVLKKKPKVQISTRYLWHFLRTKETLLQKTSKGSSIPHVDPKVLANIVVPHPNGVTQERIVEILDSAESALAARDSQLSLVAYLEEAIYLETFKHCLDFTTVFQMVGSDGQMRTGPFGSQLLHSEFRESGIAVLGIDNVVGNYFKWGQRRFISKEKYAQLSRYEVRPGDVLISIMGTIGQCVVVPRGIEVSINTKHLCSVRLDPKLCMPQYLRAAFLYEPAVQRHLGKYAKGAIMSGLNMTIIKNAPLRDASLDLQKDFEKQMERVSNLRTKILSARETELELFQTLQHLAFVERSL